MERIISIRRCRRTGNLLLNPMGTFRGYGGYVAINPYREVIAAAPPETVGQVVIELLGLAGRTNVHISEAKTFLATITNSETAALKRKYGLDKVKGTADLARRFAHVEVTFRDGQKSWLVQRFVYQTRKRLLTAVAPPYRVRHAAGAGALGEAVIEALRRPAA